VALAVRLLGPNSHDFLQAEIFQTEIRALRPWIGDARIVVTPHRGMAGRSAQFGRRAGLCYHETMAALVIGVILVGLSWIAAWGPFGVFSEHSFFPLWLGYILTINGLSQVLFKRSLLESMGWSFLLLFVISIPLWWFFEGMNAIVQNWHYHFAQPISAMRYFIQASIDFSTVVPAVLSASFFLALGLQKFGRDWPNWRPNVTDAGLAGSVLLGLGCYSLLPLFWITPILILEPVAFSIGYPSLIADFQRNGWMRLFSIMAATVITGFFWEMWNYYSLPKWTYTIPYVGFWKLFEMPLLGYFGYPFFGIIIFSYAAIAMKLMRRQNLLDVFPNAAS
jgi:hypothetical protein